MRVISENADTAEVPSAVDACSLKVYCLPPVKTPAATLRGYETAEDTSTALNDLVIGVRAFSGPNTPMESYTCHDVVTAKDADTKPLITNFAFGLNRVVLAVMRTISPLPGKGVTRTIILSVLRSPLLDRLGGVTATWKAYVTLKERALGGTISLLVLVLIVLNKPHSDEKSSMDAIVQLHCKRDMRRYNDK